MALLLLFTQDAGAPDVTAPTVSSATMAANGTSLTIVFDEAVTFGAGGNSGFALAATGSASALTYASGTGTDTHVHTSARTISSTETLTLVYTQPGNGAEDAAGNDLASFSGQAVTNNSAANSAPTDIALSNTSVLTTGGLNAVVGVASVTDPDAGDSWTMSMVTGAGDTNNASFNWSGYNLRCNDPSGMLAAYSIRVRATDSAANTYDEVFAITVAAPATYSPALSGRLHIAIGVPI